jgi:hypothetical protein
MLLLCAALALTVGVTAASSATTIGQTGPPADNAYTGGDEIVPDGYVVPAGGGNLIVSLNTQSSSCNTTFGFFQGTYNLQVLRPLGGGQYTVLGDTGDKTDPCDGQFHSYPVNIPVQAGDVLGVYVVSDWVGVLNGGSLTFGFQSEPAVGDTITVPNSFGGSTVDESATLAQVPTSTSDCKNGGWQTLVDANGNPFKNQGDCVSYVATKGKNPA